jgi:glutathione S-transferase
LEFDRIDAGMEHGRNTEPDYLAMNPTGRVPTLVDGDFVLWESNSIMRYLVLQYGGEGCGLYPSAPHLRGSIDRWLDWTLSTLQPAERPVFWGLVRTPPTERDMAALQALTDAVAKVWSDLDRHLQDRQFAEGDAFTIGDIALATYARRWFGVEGVRKPKLPNLERWFARSAERSGFLHHVAAPLT